LSGIAEALPSQPPRSFFILYPTVVRRRHEDRPALCSRAVTYLRYPRNRVDVCHSLRALGSVKALSHICPSYVAFSPITHCFAYIYPFRPVRWTSFCSARSFSHNGLLQLGCSCLYVCVPQTSLLEDTFWHLKVSTDPHILAYGNIENAEGRYPKLKIYENFLLQGTVCTQQLNSSCSFTAG